MIRAAIYGASGYTGLEIVRAILRHPKVEIVSLVSQTYAGQPVYEVFPHLKNLIHQNFEVIPPSDLTEKCDIIFCALPHGISMSHIPSFLEAGLRVIDLSGDFRLKDPILYENWHKRTHTTPDLLRSSVYGLPELRRDKIRSARLVANPGCYPTSIIIPLAPLLAKRLIGKSTVICDSKSAVSGAGRNLKESYLFTECDEDMRAYSLTSHRHIPEIEQELSDISGTQVTVCFTPHLIPIKRGMMSAIYGEIADYVTVKHIEDAFRESYGEEKFIRFINKGRTPRIRDVTGTNFCDIGFYLDKRTRKVILLSAIDNLGKGAAGQAVQNMNIMFGLPEDTGLKEGAFVP